MNIGPDTFQFARNWWYCLNQPAASVPTLPVTGTAGVYGTDPQFAGPASGTLRPKPGSPAGNYGAYAPRG